EHGRVASEQRIGEARPVGEVVVEDGAAEAGHVGDLLHRYRWAVQADGFHRGVEQLLSAVGSIGGRARGASDATGACVDTSACGRRWSPLAHLRLLGTHRLELTCCRTYSL